MRHVASGFVALMLLVAPGWTGRAEAVCRQVCSGGNDCNDLSGDARWRCIRGPSSGCRTVCSDGYGAIAWSYATGAWGYSFDQSNRGRAASVANGHCARRANDCRIVVDFVNRCAALAAQGNATVGVATGGSRREVEAASLAACRARGGTSCEVTVWACNGK
ncbi:MAG: DUF4189 domain-containing protein [Alphaproteobacteria bacterium]